MCTQCLETMHRINFYASLSILSIKLIFINEDSWEFVRPGNKVHIWLELYQTPCLGPQPNPTQMNPTRFNLARSCQPESCNQCTLGTSSAKNKIEENQNNVSRPASKFSHSTNLKAGGLVGMEAASDAGCNQCLAVFSAVQYWAKQQIEENQSKRSRTQIFWPKSTHSWPLDSCR